MRPRDLNRQALRIQRAATEALAGEPHEETTGVVPRRFEVEATTDFLSKAVRALAIVRDQLPACCSTHARAALDAHPR